MDSCTKSATSICDNFFKKIYVITLSALLKFPTPFHLSGHSLPFTVICVYVIIIPKTPLPKHLILLLCNLVFPLFLLKIFFSCVFVCLSRYFINYPTIPLYLLLNVWCICICTNFLGKVQKFIRYLIYYFKSNIHVFPTICLFDSV